MRQDTAQDIAGRLYRNLLPFGSGATHKYVLKPAYLDIFIGVFIKLCVKYNKKAESQDKNIVKRFLLNKFSTFDLPM